MKIEEIASKIKEQVKFNQEGLRLFEATVDHEPENSRIVCRMSSEIGIDFKIDAIEMVAGFVAKQMGVDRVSKKG